MASRGRSPWERIMPNLKSTLGIFAAVLWVLAAPARSQSGYELYGERSTNQRQPPEKVMDAIGVRPGMVIGEVGAGRGRYTVHLARRVGDSGKIYANDINTRSLDYLRDRCRREGIGNVETILGEVEDPLFPDDSLDMVFMVLTYHHLADPTALFRNLIPSLKPGATVVVLDPDPVKDRDPGGRESTSEEEIRKETEPAGFELVRTETFLERDNLFILRVKRP
jgi:SAM-dependent methyltransferase